MNLDFLKSILKKSYKEQATVPATLVSPKQIVTPAKMEGIYASVEGPSAQESPDLMKKPLTAEKANQEDIATPANVPKFISASGSLNDNLITSPDSTKPCYIKSFINPMVKQSLKKALSAGYGYAGPPGQLAGGSALMNESLAEQEKFKIVSLNRADCVLCNKITPHLNTYKDKKKDTMCMDCLTETPINDEGMNNLKKEIIKRAFIYNIQKSNNKDQAIKSFKSMLPDILKADQKTLPIGKISSGKEIKMALPFTNKKNSNYHDQVIKDHEGFSSEENKAAAQYHLKNADKQHKIGNKAAHLLRDAHMRHAASHMSFVEEPEDQRSLLEASSKLSNNFYKKKRSK